MTENTEIEWADHTFNPWEGCQKVGAGCDNCYAEARSARFADGKAVNWGPGAARCRTSDANWRLPLKWDRQAQAASVRPRVFCASLADVFDNEVDPQWREDLFTLIQRTPNLDWLLLTKRISNAAEMIQEAIKNFDIGYDPRVSAWPWQNVWIGATIVKQAEADRDIPKLLAVPAAKRFVSIEPLLGPVDLEPSGALDGHYVAGMLGLNDELKPTPRIDWVIVGGESGPNARPMHPEWARSLRDQCQAAGVPYWFQQWGAWVPICEMPEDATDALYRSNRIARAGENQNVLDDIYGRTCNVKTEGVGYDAARGRDAFYVVNGKPGMQMFKVGKTAAGRMLDGRVWDEYPKGGAA
jgi:protein gp37